MIGVHTPEFSFEHDGDNVRWAVRQMRIGCPVAIDSDCTRYGAPSATTTGPLCTSLRRQGRIRHHHFGEGEYQRSEMIIQQLLVRGRIRDQPHRKLCISRRRPTGQRRPARTPSDGLRLNDWALSGNWTMEQRGHQAEHGQRAARLRFHARDINLVMGPAVPRPPYDSTYCSTATRRAAQGVT